MASPLASKFHGQLFYLSIDANEQSRGINGPVFLRSTCGGGNANGPLFQSPKNSRPWTDHSKPVSEESVFDVIPPPKLQSPKPARYKFAPFLFIGVTAKVSAQPKHGSNSLNVQHNWIPHWHNKSHWRRSWHPQVCEHFYDRNIALSPA
jgi:hypothetical protein